MARSTAAVFIFCSLLLLSHAADTATTTTTATVTATATDDSKHEVTTEVLPTTTVSTVPITKEALEASFIPIRADQVHIDGPLKVLDGVGDDRRPIHIRVFQTHRPLRLNIRGRTGGIVPPGWLVGFGGRRMGAGLRFHRGHGADCEFMKRMMELKRKGDGSPMMHHHHHLLLRHKHRHDFEEKKEEGGLKKWLRGFLEQF